MKVPYNVAISELLLLSFPWGNTLLPKFKHLNSSMNLRVRLFYGIQINMAAIFNLSLQPLWVVFSALTRVALASMSGFRNQYIYGKGGLAPCPTHGITHGRPPHVALTWAPSGKRKRGRPKETWRRAVERERAEMAGINIMDRSCGCGREQNEVEATHFLPYSPSGGKELNCLTAP